MIKKSVLVVDDQKNWRELLVELLEDEFEVTSVKGYDDALKEITRQPIPFHVVVTDMRLEDKDSKNEDGLKLAKYIRQHKGYIQTIIVTGYPTLKNQNQALTEMDVFQYFEKRPSDGKGFNEKEFVRSVRQATEQAENNRPKHDVFVAMPFVDENSTDYEMAFSMIKEITGGDEFRLTCERADKGSSILQSITHGIRYAKIIVIDISELRANVFFEAGFGRVYRKNIIFIAQKGQDIPKFIRHERIRFYDVKDKSGQDAFKWEFSQALRDELKKLDHYKIESIHSVKNTVFVITSSSKTGRDTHKTIIAPSIKKLRSVYIREDEYWEKLPPENKMPTFVEMVEQVLRQEADCTIIDITENDPDVYYWAGYAYALRLFKPYCFIYEEDSTLPFDVDMIYPSPIPFSKRTSDDCKTITGRIREYCTHSGLITLSIQQKHILFLSTNPLNTPRLALNKEFREIRKLVEAKKNLILELPDLALRPEDLSATLSRHLEKKAHLIIHFSGHSNKKGELLFEDDNGNALPAATQILANLFEKFSNQTQCVLLNACYSEKQAEAIAKHIDYVIGTRNSISDEAAIAFSVGFYQALGAGESIEKAFEFGKIQSGLRNADEYDTPVLWVKGKKQ